MASLTEAIAKLRPGVNFANVDDTLAAIRWDDPLAEDFTPPTQEEVDAWFLDASKESKRLLAVAELDRRVGLGFVYGQNSFDIDDASRANIAPIASIAAFTAMGAPGFEWPENGWEWVTHDNHRHFFATPSDFVAFSLAALAAYGALFFACRAIKDAISAVVDQAGLDAIDVTAGWPG